ncbi:dienelactone hydrolase family protein [Billgrantia aerodenitrificans]|uniref:Dienelactone hydrolase family protein n=1 Tax=Billgrantia aerodenitrificans TaxID=2733483 RepID=A0ABS9AVG9_9GAMM|nr:dienelactone hydrolase family protein [Halomonas aerodenitrificans]MCE8025724.1 dienelactone hydrolase family protein [Halomonas aerodenitrificans]
MHITVFGAMGSVGTRVVDETEYSQHRRTGLTVTAHAFDVSESEVKIETLDGMADAYFVHPRSGAWPGVILWPDALSLRPAFRTISKRLAQSGYSVLVVNPHYRQKAAPIGVDASSFDEPLGREKVLGLVNAITPRMTTDDAVAFAEYLSRQESVDPKRKLGTVGYCIGGAMAMRTAATVQGRVAAVASFHGRGLVTQESSSPHRLIPQTEASALIAIAADDDRKEPEVKSVLRQAYNKVRLAAEIEVYAGTKHGWCSPDTAAYENPKHSGLGRGCLSCSAKPWSRMNIKRAHAKTTWSRVLRLPYTLLTISAAFTPPKPLHSTC